VASTNFEERIYAVLVAPLERAVPARQGLMLVALFRRQEAWRHGPVSSPLAQPHAPVKSIECRRAVPAVRYGGGVHHAARTSLSMGGRLLPQF